MFSSSSLFLTVFFLLGSVATANTNPLGPGALNNLQFFQFKKTSSFQCQTTGSRCGFDRSEYNQNAIDIGGAFNEEAADRTLWTVESPNDELRLAGCIGENCVAYCFSDCTCVETGTNEPCATTTPLPTAAPVPTPAPQAYANTNPLGPGALNNLQFFQFKKTSSFQCQTTGSRCGFDRSEYNQNAIDIGGAFNEEAADRTLWTVESPNDELRLAGCIGENCVAYCFSDCTCVETGTNEPCATTTPLPTAAPVPTPAPQAYDCPQKQSRELCPGIMTNNLPVPDPGKKEGKKDDDSGKKEGKKDDIFYGKKKYGSWYH